jgi:hypothetical protein
MSAFSANAIVIGGKADMPLCISNGGELAYEKTL